MIFKLINGLTLDYKQTEALNCEHGFNVNFYTITVQLKTEYVIFSWKETYICGTTRGTTLNLY